MARWKNQAIVAFDTETTGLNPFQGDRVIEFGAVVFRLDENGLIVHREDHSFLIHPDREIPREVTRITGITNEDVADSPTFSEVAEQIHTVLADSIAVAHNFSFDLAFLTTEFKRIGKAWPQTMAEVDTVDLSIRCFPNARSHRLSDVAARLGVPLEQAHRATDDAAACGMSFIKLAEQERVEDDLSSMLQWAHALGRPPANGPIQLNHEGILVFTEGPHEGDSIASHPLHMAWMQQARVRHDGRWQPNYDEETNAWISRWLSVRGAGRSKTSLKAVHAGDWGLDPVIATHRRVESDANR